MSELQPSYLQEAVVVQAHERSRLQKLLVLGATALMTLGLAMATDSPQIAEAATEGLFVDTYPDKGAVSYKGDWWVDENGDGKVQSTGELISPRLYYYKNCTDWAAWRARELTGVGIPGNLGNANTWDDNAPKHGFAVDNTPEPGDIAVWDKVSPTDIYGHVAVVEEVNADGSVNISEYNYGSKGSWHKRTGVRAHHYVDVNGIGMGINGQPISGGGTSSKEIAPDLFGVQHMYTASGQAEVRRFDGKTNYTSWVGGWVSADGWHTSDGVSYVVGDHNKDGRKDVYEILHQNSPSGMTEIKVLDGASNYSRFLGGWVTPEGWHSGAGTDYDLADYNRDGVSDMYVIQHQSTNSGMTEVRVLDGKSNFTRHIGGWVTADGLHSDNGVSYAVGDYNSDGKPDVYSIQHWDSNSGKVEVRVLDGATNYGSWMGGWVTPEGWHGGSSVDYDVGYYDGDSKPEVYQILHQYTSSGQTEVKVLNGASNYTAWVGGWVTPDGWHDGDGVDYSIGS